MIILAGNRISKVSSISVLVSTTDFALMPLEKTRILFLSPVTSGLHSRLNSIFGGSLGEEKTLFKIVANKP